MRRILVALFCALTASDCSELPEQGFATRYLGGSLGPVVHAAIVPTLDFAGNPIADTYQPESASQAPAVRRTVPKSSHGVVLTDCKEVANQRVGDTRDEGYGYDVQTHVYQLVLADCQAWENRMR